MTRMLAFLHALTQVRKQKGTSLLKQLTIVFISDSHALGTTRAVGSSSELQHSLQGVECPKVRSEKEL